MGARQGALGEDLLVDLLKHLMRDPAALPADPDRQVA
jgi:hypothetical protein